MTAPAYAFLFLAVTFGCLYVVTAMELDRRTEQRDAALAALAAARTRRTPVRGNVVLLPRQRSGEGA